MRTRRNPPEARYSKLEVPVAKGIEDFARPGHQSANMCSIVGGAYAKAVIHWGEFGDSGMLPFKTTRFRPMRVVAPWLALLFGLSCQAASDCDRSGCREYGLPATATISQGIAGVFAFVSDLIEDGCQECGYYPVGKVLVWASSTSLARTEEAQQLVDSSSPIEIDANGRFELAVDPGHYLACALRAPTMVCMSVGVIAHKVSTFNALIGEGVLDVQVFEPNDHDARTNPILEPDGQT